LAKIGADLGTAVTGLQWIVDSYALGCEATRDVPKLWTLKTEYLSVLELSKVKDASLLEPPVS
jgi:hypothetical protein